MCEQLVRERTRPQNYPVVFNIISDGALWILPCSFWKYFEDVTVYSHPLAMLQEFRLRDWYYFFLGNVRVVPRCSQEKSNNYLYVGCIPCLDENVPLKSRKGIMLCPIRCQFAVSLLHLLRGSPGCTGLALCWWWQHYCFPWHSQTVVAGLSKCLCCASCCMTTGWL